MTKVVAQRRITPYATLALALLAVPVDAADHSAFGGDMPASEAPSGLDTQPDRLVGAVRGAAIETRLDVIAPDHLGFTAIEQPTLYWFLSDTVDKPVEIMISDSSGEMPDYDVVTPGPAAAGFHAASLARLGMKLKPGVDYEWTVAVIFNAQSRSQDLVATGHIERVADAPAGSTARALAAAGYWYDAFDAASIASAKQPQDHAAVMARATLLRQVKLDDAATYAESPQ